MAPLHTSHSNRLIHESSPYLLQHAQNPVDWYPWGEEALTKARTENKPIIVSIGYSACHWCHVMERESFENQAIATLMNQHFVCIKVDREERPDVDAVYMDALQAMGLQGGWPLNVFLTSDAKPFYGGTYFPPQNWTQILSQIATGYAQQPEQIQESAEAFTNHLQVTDTQKYGLEPIQTTYTPELLSEIYPFLLRQFDTERGGMRRERNKFPMPAIYLFLLRYWQLTQDETALRQLHLTLDRMALGGIYDQAGGGFARYSTDAEWFAPHFEKMLYDNGQLVSLYSEAYAATQDPLYKRTVYQTIDFVARELMSPEGGFYSALDADSEGEEGKFYVWTQPEIEAILETDAALVIDYYGITQAGNWEHGYNILHTTLRPEIFAQQKNIPAHVWQQTLTNAHQKLLQARSQRIRPGLDDKILCSWNALMLRGLVDAYRVFGEPRFLELALKNAHFLKQSMTHGAQLWHTYKNGKASLTGFLEDYAFVIDAYLALYQAHTDDQWIAEAVSLNTYVMENFFDPQEDLFFFTDQMGEKLLVRKKELFDNVIPASNSAMAKNLYLLGLLTNNPNHTQLASRMLGKVTKLIRKDVQYLSNWACLLTAYVQPTAEIVIVGPEAESFQQALEQTYYPNKIVLGVPHEITSSHVPLLNHRPAVQGKTTIYVCYGYTCQLPVHSVAEARMQLIGTRQTG